MIYLDSGATTLQKPKQVFRAVQKAMESCANPGRSGHKPAREAERAVYSCREEAAELFGLDRPERVVFTQNATHSLNLAIKSLLHEGGHAVITGYEHNSVVRPLEAMKGQGVTYTAVSSCLFDPEDMARQMERAITEETRCMIVCHASNVFGSIAPLDELDRICLRHGLPMIVDASQSAGTLPLSVKKYPSAAFFCMPGHKGLYGPQGTGLLICCKDNPLYTIMEGGTGSRSLEVTQPDFLPDALESGTLNVPGIAGLWEGLKFIKQQGEKEILRWEQELVGILVQQLRGHPSIRVFAGGENQGGVLSVVFPIPSEEAAEKLAGQGICVRAGLHCAPLAHRTAGTLPDGTVRLSVSALNTKREMLRAADAMAKMLTN